MNILGRHTQKRLAVIVDPDFFDHWKTQMLVDLLDGDELAPVYVMRLWGHCQNRKAWRFDGLPTAGLKAICRYKGDASRFEAALTECGFVVRDGDVLEVSGWAEHNASLVANWENGAKGGRPNKKNPSETHKKPKNNPPETQSKPMGNPSATHGEPIREEKRREEKRSNTKPLVANSRDEQRAPKWTPEDRAVADEILKGVVAVAPSAKGSAKWPDHVRLMREQDGKTHAEILDMFRWANRDAFWRANILSPAKLREKWATLEAKRNSPTQPFKSRHERTQEAIEEFAGSSEEWSGRVYDA